MRSQWIPRLASRLPFIALLALLAPAGVASVAAMDRPAVKVAFSLAEPVFEDEFTAQEKKALEAAVTTFLAGRLGGEIGFLRFVSAGPADFVLSFRLGDPQASKTSFHEVGFQISLAGPGGGAAATSWPFRDRNAWGTSTGSRAQFETEIRTRLAQRPPGDLVPDLLSQIPVASEGVLIREPPIEIAWILPFRQSDLCLDLKSEVRLATEVTSALGALPQEFRAAAVMVYNPPGQVAQEELRNRVLCIPLQGQDGLDVVRQSAPSAVKVKKIFIVSYRKMASGCEGPLPPSEVAGSFGGGR